MKIYDCYAAGSGWWNVIGRPLLLWGSRGDTESDGQGLVGACEGCRNTGLIARLIGTPASCCGSWLALSRLISPFVPPSSRSFAARSIIQRCTDETGFIASADIILEFKKSKSFVEEYVVN